MAKIYIKSPIVNPDQLDDCISDVVERGLDSSVSSCLVLLICSLAAIWGNFPETDVRELSDKDTPASPSMQRRSLAIPDYRMAESLSYMDMARKRMSAAYLDDSLVGVQCFCLFG